MNNLFGSIVASFTPEKNLHENPCQCTEEAKGRYEFWVNGDPYDIIMSTSIGTIMISCLSDSPIEGNARWTRNIPYYVRLSTLRIVHGRCCERKKSCLMIGTMW